MRVYVLAVIVGICRAECNRDKNSRHIHPGTLRNVEAVDSDAGSAKLRRLPAPAISTDRHFSVEKSPADLVITPGLGDKAKC
jgi:hypothetical protein